MGTEASLKPLNETARLELLRSLNILDTPPETLFDDLVLLASEVSGSPISAITLLDSHRQWFKAVVGADVTESPREISFCTHTILNEKGEAFIVEDTLKDDRFVDNPFVNGEIKVRFYAGFPLVLFNEYAVGSLCVIDRESKMLTEQQLETLKQIADIAIKRLEALSPDQRSEALAAFLR